MINKVILIGNLGRDPEIKYTQSGTAVATLSIATTRKVKGKDGQYQDETEWHRCIAWDKSAKFCGEYLAKGARVYVEGRLQTRKWKDKSGVDRDTTEIVAHQVMSLSPMSREGRGDSGEHGLPPEPFGGDNGGTGEDSIPF